MFRLKYEDKKMCKKIKTFFLGATIFAASTVAFAESPSRLDVASGYSIRNMFGASAVNVAEKVNILSGGELKVKVYEPGELVPPFEILNSVSSGAVSAGWSSIAYFAGTLPIANLYGALPFSPSAEAIFSWTAAGEGRELLQKSLDKFGVKVVPCSYLPQEPGGWFNKDITSIEDFKGLAMRISGLGAKVLNKYGAITQLIPGGEVYLALERGRVDAAEFSIPQVDMSMGLQEIAKNYYFPGWQQGAGWLALLINKEVWNGYSEKHQATIETVCKANIQREFDEVVPAQVRALRELKEKGVIVKRFPASVLTELHKGWEEVREEEMRNNPEFKEAYESLMKHSALVDEWYELQQISK
jgi:TRAP-type mannitol/chloroaromatic compound transport system substrate-binding protein